MVEGVETTVLIATRAQVSTITEGFCKEFRVAIYTLGGLLHLQGTGGSPFHTKDRLK